MSAEILQNDIFPDMENLEDVKNFIGDIAKNGLPA